MDEGDNFRGDKVDSGESAFMNGLFSPGVGSGTHMLLRLVLVALNVILLGMAVAGINSPHSAIMFLLSVGLTGSYFWFMMELAKASKSD
mmetsp:Transcript_40898/g.161975  ORF Transcript_40898/g.161975 Transcript_40898/m.161975 type:complete len:89 (+) Transcript_40898:319-585(+)|eukprot:CAMPEP_0113955332 /NCGR_PEP_ID=MMETSP0011_2-20120614/1254_1 /TAXON_ID=101924 /ORGANISM="Rhodosorus marinus" /LENGTH=88 /DNA_ID=CAMNT_0000964969 /DNA_START=106 /DNA_END=372 /DNA_ORIENTATION=- /assembly_acc=CAM_ASM_000156